MFFTAPFILFIFYSKFPYVFFLILHIPCFVNFLEEEYLFFPHPPILTETSLIFCSYFQVTTRLSCIRPSRKISPGSLFVTYVAYVSLTLRQSPSGPLVDIKQFKENTLSQFFLLFLQLMDFLLIVKSG